MTITFDFDATQGGFTPTDGLDTLTPDVDDSAGGMVEDTGIWRVAADGASIEQTGAASDRYAHFVATADRGLYIANFKLERNGGAFKYPRIFCLGAGGGINNLVKILFIDGGGATDADIAVFDGASQVGADLDVSAALGGALDPSATPDVEVAVQIADASDYGTSGDIDLTVFVDQTEVGTRTIAGSGASTNPHDGDVWCGWYDNLTSASQGLFYRWRFDNDPTAVPGGGATPSPQGFGFSQ